ncbi:hypothetical protein VOLCADRAFT_106049 [Volvox carteri f. nagariensis]|uniref:Uncharacterized protein n=1 Tax=Volvox carteri f. nagariensis TaxID=3068 RepID=D8U4R8_VOLCA|nr:uncharacterized protein VOLCADRAFT_106049 [Volvox carteri f. nagariensis]EFJ45322.1 hypothetical protein VOLCADRAFT_106049 [Volvox carteri f. nagariensis]|eukprot:XP_002953698.1 hypothetical protein VOLCADRAFT_106049 [Volvox carteri f. nagariensis]
MHHRKASQDLPNGAVVLAAGAPKPVAAGAAPKAGAVVAPNPVVVAPKGLAGAAAVAPKAGALAAPKPPNAGADCGAPKAGADGAPKAGAGVKVAPNDGAVPRPAPKAGCCAGWPKPVVPANAAIFHAEADMQMVTQMARPLPKQTVDKGKIWSIFIGGAVVLFGITIVAENNETLFPAITRANRAFRMAAKQIDEEEERQKKEEELLRLRQAEYDEEQRQLALVQEGMREARAKVIGSSSSAAQPQLASTAVTPVAAAPAAAPSNGAAAVASSMSPGSHGGPADQVSTSTTAGADPYVVVNNTVPDMGAVAWPAAAAATTPALASTSACAEGMDVAAPTLAVNGAGDAQSLPATGAALSAEEDAEAMARLARLQGFVSGAVAGNKSAMEAYKAQRHVNLREGSCKLGICYERRCRVCRIVQRYGSAHWCGLSWGVDEAGHSMGPVTLRCSVWALMIWALMASRGAVLIILVQLGLNGGLEDAQHLYSRAGHLNDSITAPAALLCYGSLCQKLQVSSAKERILHFFPFPFAWGCLPHQSLLLGSLDVCCRTLMPSKDCISGPSTRQAAAAAVITALPSSHSVRVRSVGFELLEF